MTIAPLGLFDHFGMDGYLPPALILLFGGMAIFIVGYGVTSFMDQWREDKASDAELADASQVAHDDDEFLLPRPIEAAADIARDHGVSRVEFDAALNSGALPSSSGGSRNAQDRKNDGYVIHADLTNWLNRRQQ